MAGRFFGDGEVADDEHRVHVRYDRIYDYYYGVGLPLDKHIRAANVASRDEDIYERLLSYRRRMRVSDMWSSAYAADITREVLDIVGRRPHDDQEEGPRSPRRIRSLPDLRKRIEMETVREEEHVELSIARQRTPPPPPLPVTRAGTPPTFTRIFPRPPPRERTREDSPIGWWDTHFSDQTESDEEG